MYEDLENLYFAVAFKDVENIFLINLENGDFVSKFYNNGNICLINGKQFIVWSI